jgi:predicted RNA binding protein YcfA (HicA-like mRNA interferase family)
MLSRDLIKELVRDGWTLHSVTGSHHHDKHPSKPGKVTLPHAVKDMHLKSARRQAGLA